jgi:hypothetical protein
MKPKTKDQIDAERYRFLRSKSASDHRHHKRSAMRVIVVDWGRNLPGYKKGESGAGMWCQADVTGRELDKQVDAMMLRNKGTDKSSG